MPTAASATAAPASTAQLTAAPATALVMPSSERLDDVVSHGLSGSVAESVSHDGVTQRPARPARAEAARPARPTRTASPAKQFNDVDSSRTTRLDPDSFLSSMQRHEAIDRCSSDRAALFCVCPALCYLFYAFGALIGRPTSRARWGVRGFGVSLALLCVVVATVGATVASAIPPSATAETTVGATTASDFDSGFVVVPSGVVAAAGGQVADRSSSGMPISAPSLAAVLLGFFGLVLLLVRRHQHSTSRARKARKGGQAQCVPPRAGRASASPTPWWTRMKMLYCGVTQLVAQLQPASAADNYKTYRSPSPTTQSTITLRLVALIVILLTLQPAAAKTSLPSAVAEEPPNRRALQAVTTVYSVGELTTALSTSSVNEIVLAASGSPFQLSSQLTISRDVTLRAEAAGQVVIDGQSSTRIFQVNSGRVHVEGLVFTNGYSGASSGAGRVTGGTVTFNVCSFTNNRARNGYNCGGVAIEGGDVSFTTCTFSGNEAVGSGNGHGGSVCSGDFTTTYSMTRLENCHFENNRARYGPAWAGSGSAFNTYISNCTFINNHATSAAGWGGALAMDGTGNVYVNASTFTSNEADNGGGVLKMSNGEVIMHACTFSNNLANQGGVLHMMGGRLLIDACLLINNHASTNGGAISTNANDFVLQLDRTTFEANTAVQGVALYSAPAVANVESYVKDCTFRGHTNDASTIEQQSSLRWICPLGYWASLARSYVGDFSGCANPCPAGVFGDSPELSTASCSGVCPEGHFCPEGTSSPISCPAGTILPATGGSSQSSCIPCSPGTSSALMGNGNSSCTTCPPGTLSDDLRATSCDQCPVGGFCAAEGAASVRQTFEACPAGTYNPTPGASSNMSCIACPLGKANSIPGSSSSNACTDCLPGSHASENGTAICALCEPGKYQGSRGQTACVDCTPGSFCVEGASSPMPCPGGTHKNASLAVMTSVDDCLSCGVGEFCPVGSADATPCAPGTYNAQSEQQMCQRCPAGKYQSQEGATACVDCPAGSHCAEGAGAALLCDAGSFRATTDATSQADCTTCPAGSACATGATAHTPCEAGTIAATDGESVCTACSAGSYQSASGATACVDCPAGSHCLERASAATSCSAGSFTATSGESACASCVAGTYQSAGDATACITCPAGSHCAQGASAALLCDAGSFRSTEGATSQADCTPCPLGHFCFPGATAPSTCSVASYAAESGKALCDGCLEGTYQDDEGSSACKECPDGYFCPAGSAAAIPGTCDAGTYVNGTYTSKDDCVDCPKGYACAGGTSQPAICRPGNIAPDQRITQCAECAGGKYTEAEGATACEECTRGSYCKQGSSTPVPCPGGTSSNLTARSSVSQCSPVPVNFWAPLGSAFPEPCPPIGFYCPGAAADTVNDPPGSKPILQASGGATTTEEVPAVEASLTIDMTIDEFKAQETAMIKELAKQYGVNPSQITLTTTAGSLELTITIAVPPSAPGAPSASSASDVAAAVAAVDDASLSSSLGASLGIAISVTTSTAPTVATVQRTVTIECPAGQWCDSGLIVNCTEGTYNDQVGQSSPTACKVCPEGKFQPTPGQASCETCGVGSFSANVLSCEPCEVGAFCVGGQKTGERCPAGFTTAGRGASSDAECGCYEGLYEIVSAEGARSCVECGTGTNCSAANTKLEALPVAEGYWRQKSGLAEIRVCFTAAACLGGPNVSAQCAPSQTGPYCAVCADGFFGGGDGSLCEPCEGSTVVTFLPLIILGVVALLLIVFLGMRCCRKTAVVSKLAGSARHLTTGADGAAAAELEGELTTASRTRLKRLWNRILNSGVALKILISLFQMLFGIGLAFSIPYPPGYLAVLNFLSSILQIDLVNAMPLSCVVGIGFFGNLAVRTALPLAAVVLLALIGRVLKRMGKAEAAALCASGWFYILFLIYPSCASAVFQAVTCDTLPDGTPTLRVDYSIACWEGEHLVIVAYAAVMAFIYPIGTPCLYAALLYVNREAIARIQRAELVAEAEGTKLSQRKLSTLHHWDVHEVAGSVTGSQHWEMDQGAQKRESLVATLDSEHAASADAQKLRRELPTAVQRLTAGYEMRCYWFEIFECVRKLLLIGFPVFLPYGSAAQLMFGLLVNFISFGLYTAYSPFVDAKDDRLSTICQVVLFFALMSSIALKLERDSSSEVLGVLLTVTMAAPLVLAFLFQSGFDVVGVLRVPSAMTALSKLFDHTVGRCLTYILGGRKVEAPTSEAVASKPEAVASKPEAVASKPEAVAHDAPFDEALISASGPITAHDLPRPLQDLSA